MENLFLILPVLFCILIPTGRASLHARLDENWTDDVVSYLDLGDEIQLTCTASASSIEFHFVGIRGKIEYDSIHSTLFPGLNPVITEMPESYFEAGQRVFRKNLTLTVIAELNDTAVQCGITEYDKASRRRISVYSLGALLRVKNDRENSTNTVTPQYVDINLREGGEQRIGDKVNVECNSSSEHIVFCVIGVPCESEHSHALPSGSNPSLSDPMEYYCNESRRTMYWRALELDVVAELDNIGIQCKAGEAFTRGVLLKVADATIHPTPTGSLLCPSPSETVKMNGSVCCGGQSPSLSFIFKLVLIGIWTATLLS